MRGSLKIELVQLHRIGNLEARKEGDAGAQAKARATGRTVGIGIVERQTTSEAETLGSRAVEVWQARVLSCGQLEFALFATVLALLDVDVMLDGIVGTLAERPRGLR